MKITVSVDNNREIITLPKIPYEGIEIDYGSSSAVNCDSTKYGQIKKLGAEPLATVNLEGTFYKKDDPLRYVKFFRDNRKNRKPMRIVITSQNGKTIFNRLMNCETFSFAVDPAGNYNFALGFEQYRKVK